MKKKNIAMMMAGVTVASAVAPVFAAQNDVKIVNLNVKDGEETAKGINDLLAVKFDDVKGLNKVNESVYEVKIGDTVVTNSLQVANAINENEKTVLNITDKGHKVVDSKVVNYTTEKYENTGEIVEAAKAARLTAEVTSVDTVVVKTGNAKEEVTVKVGDTKLDFNKKELDVNNKFVGFEQLFTDIAEIKYQIIITKEEAVNSTELFDGVRLTEKGAELLAAITTNSTIKVQDDVDVAGEDSEFTVETSFNILNGTDVVATIVNEDPQVIKELKAILRGEQANVNLVAGEDRFTTAVEVSKQLVGENETANAVVLVGEDAIVDGLAAAPLAKKVGAPILLTKANQLPEATEKEMLRVLGNNLSNKTVYLVGGEARISKELEAKIAKLGVKVERLAGDTRFETSLKIAEKVTSGATVDTAFVVGGNGEADAMSISAYAAKKEAPIVVVDKNEVSEEAMELLEGKNIEIIGGTGVVSEEVEAQLKEMVKEDSTQDNTVVRLAGNTRQETNAKVINAHYSNPTVALIAKDGYVGGNGKLIDALTAAPLAAEMNAPIILTTNELTKEQADVVEVKLSTVEKLVQVGKGIADAAIKAIVEKIGSNN
ncbi:cell wall-binding repeat-containing protein [Romboutsia timonensis]|uniref:cell wall-binding repeat-containing protein n=1 Tax=Romboutsia timonensis TaxID=1776391 RepID=UPI002A801155|nr:cell wall-binding repeat-containing protein [Romboutsia timonensis]MDY3960352.1 cell wall-binding repeat-containing protein [Romboutsia timonensis]